MVHSSIDKTDSETDEDQMESNEEINNEEETDEENIIMQRNVMQKKRKKTVFGLILPIISINLMKRHWQLINIFNAGSYLTS